MASKQRAPRADAVARRPEKPEEGASSGAAAAAAAAPLVGLEHVQENIQNNARILYYRCAALVLVTVRASSTHVRPCTSRTFLSIFGGVAAGILGLTGLAGFLFYILVMLLSSVAVLLKARLDVGAYFPSWQQLVFDGIGQGMMVSSPALRSYFKQATA
eukprot:SM000124S25958  [mRNA]  locus=s124:360095:361023:+ [translate_table: standard]